MGRPEKSGWRSPSLLVIHTSGWIWSATTRVRIFSSMPRFARGWNIQGLSREPLNLFQSLSTKTASRLLGVTAVDASTRAKVCSSLVTVCESHVLLLGPRYTQCAHKIEYKRIQKGLNPINRVCTTGNPRSNLQSARASVSE